MSVRVLVVDDNAVTREMVRGVLSLDRDIVVVGEAGNGLEAVRLAGFLCPDIVIMDISMPVMDGVEATGQISRSFPEIRTVAFSMSDSLEDVARSRGAGAKGYILKESMARELVPAVRQVLNGGTYYSAGLRPKSSP